MDTLRFAIFGTGFWSRFQLAAWQELDGAECVAVYNRTVSKAEALAEEFGVPAVYGDAEALLDNENLDFVDIITNPDTHSEFVHMVAERGLPVICQKPMATSLAEAEEMVAVCQQAGVPYFVHENWRWQTPIRHLKAALDSGAIGEPFRAQIDMFSGFPVFVNQPFLAEEEKFILTDIGSHILDTARFMFGEANSLYCRTQQIHDNIKGEDVATVILQMGSHTTVVCKMGYPENYLEHDVFPETLVFIEGDQGSLELGRDYWIRTTTEEGTFAKRVPPSRYPWADPDYDVVHSSIVPCNADILQALQGKGEAETTGEDNLETMRLVYKSYESAERDEVLRFD